MEIAMNTFIRICLTMLIVGGLIFVACASIFPASGDVPIAVAFIGFTAGTVSFFGLIGAIIGFIWS